MIAAIIFDIGGILEPSYSIVLELADFIGLNVDTMRDHLLRVHGELSDGKMSLQEAYGQLVASSGTAMPARRAVEKHLELYRAATLTTDHRVLSLIERLKHDYTVACLTNTEMEVGQLNRQRGYFQVFHKAFLSTEIGLHKPDPRVFEYVLRDLGCGPAAAVFVDDRIENVQGARTAGLHAIHYEGFDSFPSALNQVLGSA
jgi:putative hydrolase of the HAD superfamily